MLWLLPSVISYQRKGGEDLKSSHQQTRAPPNKWNPLTDFSYFLFCLQLASDFLKIDFCAVVIPSMCPCLLNTLPFFPF